MRNTFINTLCELAARHEDIFLVCGDLGYSVLEPFARQFPDRFLNAGVAEQNMTQVAAGLAREGYNVFTYSIGNFPTLRCIEQVRYDVCYHGANVKVIAVGGGYAYGPQGASHHTTEDIGMMRILPGMTVCVPADRAEARAAASFMATRRGPGYVRLNKNGETDLHGADDPLELIPGRFLTVEDGTGTLVLATGPVAAQIRDELAAHRPGWALWTAPFVGGYDRDLLVSISQRFERIVTVEEHQLNGGFGSSIAEAFCDLHAADALPRLPKIERIGIANRFIGTSGSQEDLRKAAGLTLTRLFEG
jgi:transketolase